MRELPLSREDLVHAYSFLEHPLPYDDLLWLTQSFCGFFALLRLDDLVWPDAVHLHQYAFLVSRLSVELTEDRLAFTLPGQRTDVIQRLHSTDMIRGSCIFGV